MIRDLTNCRFSKLVVLRREGSDIHRKALWRCSCDCGNTHLVSGQALTSGASTSCGCYNRSKSITHGLFVASARPTTYTVWQGMKNRCYNNKDKRYKDWGGRGITVCSRWLKSFTNFLEDMGDKPIGYSLDRIDNDVGYNKDNCKWSTPKEQANNRRNNTRRFI